MTSASKKSGMALQSCLNTTDMVRRKRPRSPATLPRDDEEPHEKLRYLRNMDINSGGKNGYSTAICADLPHLPEYRQNGLYAEANPDPQTRRQVNGFLKKKSKDITKGKGLKLLRMNFALLKEEMEPIQVVDYLKENGQVGKFNELHRRTVDRKWRTERVETLMKGLFALMNDENEDEIFKMIIDALVQSRQTELAQELQKEPDSFCLEETELKSENKRLLHFFAEKKGKILKKIKPQKVVQEIFDLQGIDFEDYDKIINEHRREICVDILFKTLESRRGREWQILRPVYNWYRKNFSECESYDKAERATSSSHESTEVKVSYEPVVAQDSSEHTDPLSQLRELQQRVVQNIDGNEDRFNDLDQSLVLHCTSRLQKISFSSINLHLQPMTDESIQKLLECCKGEEVKQWIISILGRDDLKTLKELQATTFTVKVFVKNLQTENKYKVFDEATEGCLCVVNKDCLKNNREQFKEVTEGLEIELTNSLLEHDTLSDDLEEVLHTTRRTEELVDFLCNQNIPQVSYCFIENDVLKNNRRDFISQLRQEISYTSDCLRMLSISNSDIKEHRELLEEELDANWFVSSLLTRGDKASKDMVEIIENSSSRRYRTRLFIQYLCKVDEKEIDWIAFILQQKHPHLLEILQPEILKNVAEVRHGLLSLYDYLVDELDPEEFSRSLKASSHEKLECAQLTLLRSKRERCMRFLANLLKKENSYLVPEVLNAMKTYKSDIYNTVQRVLEKGSLSEYYRCPRIEKESLKSSKCCFKTKISLTEDAKEGLIRTINQNKTADICGKQIAVKATQVPEISSSSNESSISCYDPYSRKQTTNKRSPDPGPPWTRQLLRSTRKHTARYQHNPSSDTQLLMRQQRNLHEGFQHTPKKDELDRSSNSVVGPQGPMWNPGPRRSLCGRPPSLEALNKALHASNDEFREKRNFDREKGFQHILNKIELDRTSRNAVPPQRPRWNTVPQLVPQELDLRRLFGRPTSLETLNNAFLASNDEFKEKQNFDREKEFQHIPNKAELERSSSSAVGPQGPMWNPGPQRYLFRRSLEALKNALRASNDELREKQNFDREKSKP